MLELINYYQRLLFKYRRVEIDLVFEYQNKKIKKREELWYLCAHLCCKSHKNRGRQGRDLIIGDFKTLLCKISVDAHKDKNKWI